MPERRTARRALAMLAKVPTPGLVKTRLVPPLDFDAAAALARAFIRDTAARLVALAPALEAELFLYHAPDAGELHVIARGMTLRPQGAGDLGDRMRAIVAALRGEGYAHAVLVGADSPTLPGTCVAAAFEALDAGADVAIARADDGGYVLLGVDGPHAALFESMPWSTDRVYATSVARARAAGLAVTELPGWYDVDDARDLDRLRRECSTGAAALAPATCALLGELRV